MTSTIDIHRWRGKMVVTLADMLQGTQLLLASDTLEDGACDSETASYAKLACDKVAANPWNKEAWLALIKLIESTDQSDRNSHLRGIVDPYPDVLYHGARIMWKGNDMSGRHGGASPFITWSFEFLRNQVECRWCVGFPAQTSFLMPEGFIERLVPYPWREPDTSK
jgi:hypothetical protein